jgi:DNA-binding NtrC family response regulator
MTVALYASKSISLPPITQELQEYGLSVKCHVLNTKSPASTIGEDVETCLLISDEPNIVELAEEIQSVREAIGEDRRLIVCAMDATERLALIEFGASEVIQAASKERIGERICGQLISDGYIKPDQLGGLVGAAKPMRRVYEHMERVAKMKDPVLIRGERGTGKMLVAQEIHRLSQRRGKYVYVNCPELQKDLIPSELFGHEKGAFTGAIGKSEGLIRSAESGTIFLDEIGDLDKVSQAKLLAVVEYNKVRPVGACGPVHVDVRFIVATSNDLENACERGDFRRDLLDRFTFCIHLPPLRERKADIPLLAQHFVNEFSRETEKQIRMTPEFEDALFEGDWQENVRGFRAAIRTAALYADAPGTLSSIQLQEQTKPKREESGESRPGHTTTSCCVEFDPGRDTYMEASFRMGAAYHRSLLDYCKGDKPMAMRRSGLQKSAYYKQLGRYGLK